MGHLLILPIDSPDTMRLAVTDKDRSIAIDEDPVQSIQFALEWIPSGTVTLDSCACDEFDCP
jgi:hypothetical protein